jgi:hypothetical protein
MSQDWNAFNAVKPKDKKEHLDPRDWRQPDEPLVDAEPVYSIPSWATSWLAVIGLCVIVLCAIVYFLGHAPQPL